MAATLKGKGIIYAVAGITYSAGITVGAAEQANHQSLNFERSADASYVKSSAGDDIAAAYANLKKNITITVIPSGTAISDARLLSDSFLIAPGTLVTIADADGTIIDGSYNVVRSRATRSVDGAQANELELENRDANNITSVVS